MADPADQQAPSPKAASRRRSVLLAVILGLVLAYVVFGPKPGDRPKSASSRARKPAAVAKPSAGSPAPSSAVVPPATAPSEAAESPPAAPSADATAQPADAAIRSTDATVQPDDASAEMPRQLPDNYATPGDPKPGTVQSPMEAYREPGPEPAAPAPTTILAKIRRYAETVVERWDTDGDRRLSAAEWRQMPGDPAAADLNGDGLLEPQEIAARVAVYSRRRMIRLMPVEPAAPTEPATVASPSPAPPLGEPTAAEIELARRARQFYVPDAALPSGVPQWFTASDANGDAQVSMAEFSAQWSDAELDRFKHYDTDGDGLITITESLAARDPATPPTASAANP